MSTTPEATDREARKRIHETLRNLRRRYVLYYLTRNGGTADLDDLAVTIAAWEYNTSSESVTARERKSVYNALYQTHLPKLEDLNLVRYDGDTKTVRLSERGRDIDIHVARDLFARSGWPAHYLRLSGLGLVVAGLHLAGVYPFSAASPAIVLVAVLAVVTAVSLAHRREVARWKDRFTESGPDFVIEIEE